MRYLAEEMRADVVDCPGCLGSGWTGNINQPLDPDARYRCPECDGTGWCETGFIGVRGQEWEG